MKQSNSCQWQKNNGYIYNSTDLGTIKSITITSSTGTFTTYYGNTAQPSSSTTVGGGFFQIKVGNATGNTSKIEIVFTPSSDDQRTVTTTTIDATGITNTDVNKGTNAGSLTATVTANGTAVLGATVTWTSSDEDVAKVDENGNVTLVGAGSTEIKARYAGDDTYKDSEAIYTLQVEAMATEETFTKVTSTSELEDGKYLIVYEDGNYILNSNLENLDVADNYKEITIDNNTITTSTNYAFTIDKTEGTIKSSKGYYIGQKGDINILSTTKTLTSEDKNSYTISITIDNGNADIVASDKSGHLRFNNTSGQKRFRFFKNASYANQKVIALYKQVSSEPGLYFTSTDVTADYITGGTYQQTATCRNLGNPSPAITYSMEPVNEGADISSIAEIDAATGEVTFVGIGDVKITAATTFEGTAYTASYTLHIVEPDINLFELVTSQDEIVDGGEYLIVEKSLNNKVKAYYGQHGSNAYADNVQVTKNGIEIDNATPQAHVITLEATTDGHWYLKDSNDNCYLTSGTTNGHMLFESTPTEYSKWDINVEQVNTTIVNVADNTFQIKYNGTTSANLNFSCYTGVYTFVQLFKRASALSDAGISYNEPTTYKINLGDKFTAPALNNPNKVTPVTFLSSNPSVITVNETTGAITVKRAGSATISAVFAGDATYKKDVATYVLNVSKVKNEGLIFNETFDQIFSNGGNDSQFSGSVATYYMRNAGWTGQKPGDDDTLWDDAWQTDEIWTMFDTDAERTDNNSYVQAGSQCVKFGAGKNETKTEGVLQTSSFSMGDDVTQGTLTFSAAGWGTGENYLEVTATGCTLTYKSNTGNSTVSENRIITDVTGPITLTFRGWRGFIDEIAVGGPYSVTITSAGYASLYYGSAPLIIPEGVEAYTLHTKDVDGYKDVEKGVTLEAGDKLPAGTGVILKGEPGTYLFPFDFSNVEKIDAENILEGSDNPQTFDDEGYEYFVLSKVEGEIGYYHQTNTGGKYVMNGAHKAFFRIPAGESILHSGSAGVKGYSLDAIITTGIEEVATDEQSANNSHVIYNLSGQRVAIPSRGIYIINGKKVLIK